MELYQINADIEEQHNVIGQHADVVKELLIHVEKARISLGDALTERVGRDNRKVGMVGG